MLCTFTFGLRFLLHFGQCFSLQGHKNFLDSHVRFFGSSNEKFGFCLFS